MVGQFGDDHRIAVGASLALHGFNRRHAAHRHRAPAGGVGLADAAPAQDLAAGGEVGAGDDRQQLAVFELRIGDQGQQAIDQFGEVVGRDVGGHPHGNAGGPIEQQVGHPRRHHGGLLLGAIEVVDEIDGFGLDVLEQAVGGEGLQARFGVSHGGRGVVIDRAEVAVTIDQRHAHREVLGHAHQGVVDGRVAVGVVLTQHFPHDPGAFAVGPIAGQAQLVHRIQDAAMHRFEAIAGIGQGPAHDHAHRILQVGARHFVAKVGLDDPPVGCAGTGWIRHS